MATNIGMMDSAYFVGRNELLTWINDRLQLNLSRVEEVCCWIWASICICMCAFADSLVVPCPISSEKTLTKCLRNYFKGLTFVNLAGDRAIDFVQWIFMVIVVVLILFHLLDNLGN